MTRRSLFALVLGAVAAPAIPKRGPSPEVVLKDDPAWEQEFLVEMRRGMISADEWRARARQIERDLASASDPK